MGTWGGGENFVCIKSWPTWPPEIRPPRSPTRVEYPSFISMMKSCAYACLAAETTCSIVYSCSSRPYFMLSKIVRANSGVSYGSGVGWIGRSEGAAVSGGCQRRLPAAVASGGCQGRLPAAVAIVQFLEATRTCATTPQRPRWCATLRLRRSRPSSEIAPPAGS